MASHESFRAKAKPAECIGNTKKVKYVIFDLNKIREDRAKPNSSEIRKDIKIVKKFNNNKLGGYIPGDDLLWHQQFT